MKKIKLHLTLNKEMIRHLGADERKQVVGGATAGCPLNSINLECPSRANSNCTACNGTLADCFSAICLPD